jgi:hypothetical protein
VKAINLTLAALTRACRLEIINRQAHQEQTGTHIKI